MLVRSLLAVSLSYIMCQTAFAISEETPVATTDALAVASAPVSDPIDPLVLDSKGASQIMADQESNVVASEVHMSTEEQKHLDNVSHTAQTIDAGAEKQNTTKSVSKAEKGNWTVDGINNSEWIPSLGRGQFPAYARAQVMLNNAHASPGAIDGSSGKNMLKAIASFQQMQGLKTTGALDQDTWNALVALQDKPAFQEYTISESDLKGPYAKEIPHDYALQAKMKGLYYTRVTEMLGEKFHMDEGFLKQINPKADFNKLGQKIIVTNVRNNLPEDIHLIVAHKGAKQLYLFNSQNQMVGSFPATIGSSDTPSPTGTYKVTGATPNPWYSYSPSNFVQGNNLKPLMLPPGPNAPVGNIWIGLSKRSFGIHGTPNPSAISKTASHGCIRLTNWDANDLGRKVKVGTIVKFLD
ncbi:L,D-transpeptidase family protein [Acinetobacter rathckeae]|uniref:L,D-transpeptidase family protein n=1 Tax=Acinetobacter rathckeae TaxID=2605272 RepID=UPI0018A31FA4|nr:L,D-transpeptidase family protein [Acinetobacter rathckeae]MBF7686917.1 murein L,D-transpeptidase [Acinetobacter rathckeae]MBF7694679.1 murein L,D-transpeptidase [Acinetobacter rathckeae]